jgi:hypothetical protein
MLSEQGSLKMNDSEVNEMLFSAYLLGQRVLYEAGLASPVKVRDDKSWELLREIAEGSTTLTNGPADMLLRTPLAAERAEAMKEYLAQVTPKVIAHDRQIAMRVLDGANRRM